MKRYLNLAMLGVMSSILPVSAFEGHIQARAWRGGPPSALIYTVDTNCFINYKYNMP